MASQLTYSGKALIAGFPGTVTPTGVAGVASFFKTDGNLTVERSANVITDSAGDPQAVLSTGGLYRLSINFTPAGATNAAVVAAVAEPTPCARVTLASFALASVNHARWIYWPGSWKLAFTADNKATYSLEIVCSADATVDLSTTIS